MHKSSNESTERAFPVTPWSALLQEDGDGSTALAAWEELARSYWHPLFVFLRRKKLDHDAANDAIQGFFAHMLRREFLVNIRRGDGLFRSFLLAALKNWLIDQHRTDTALKRGGGATVIPLDELHEASGEQGGIAGSSEEAFDRQWARAVFDHALEDLSERLKNRGREAHFLKLRGVVTGEATESYAKIAADLEMTEGAVRQAALELRREFGKVLRQQIRRTVADEDQIDSEIRYLIQLLRG